MSGSSLAEIDPVSAPFVIGASARLVTAGSCFAQHIARHLAGCGRACFETEPAHPLMTPTLAADYHFGIYAARHGNIYTARQLLQTWRRANGRFLPTDDAWVENGAWFDPFRPTIQPGGFSSRREYDEDRRQHLAAVRRAWTDMDVFVFTLGLTECWASREDGAVYPLCPGVAAGAFDPQRHERLDFSVAEVVADMTAFIDEVRAVNPGLRVILSVSPVPLAATAQDEHVLVATSHAKAVLRVAAGELARRPGVCYFPAYEIITLGGADYFAADRRSIRECGVERVMSLFCRHFLEGGEAMPVDASMQAAPAEPDAFLDYGQRIVDTLCDEQRLDPQEHAQR